MPRIEMMGRSLADAIGAAGLAADRGALNIPILKAVQIESNGTAATFTATNQDQTASYTVACGGDAFIMWLSLDVLGSKRASIRADKPLAIEYDGKAAEITQGRSRWKIPAMIGDSFPRAAGDSLADRMYLTFPRAALAAMASLVSFAADDGSRFYLEGVFVDTKGENITLVATDGHVLAAYPITQPPLPVDGLGFILPTDAISKLNTYFREAEYCELRTDDRAALFTAEGQHMRTKLVEGTFPDWRRVVEVSKSQATGGTVSLDRELAMDSLARATSMAMDTSQSMGRYVAATITFGDGEMVVMAKNKTGEEASDACPIDMMESEPGSIVVNGSLMTLVLKSFPEGCNILMARPTEDGRATVFWQDGFPENVRLLMPLRG